MKLCLCSLTLLPKGLIGCSGEGKEGNGLVATIAGARSSIDKRATAWSFGTLGGQEAAVQVS